MVNAEPYHGWLIEVIKEQSGYCFRCYCPDRALTITDRQSYATPQQAFRAAWLRADLESVRISLTSFLNSKLRLLWLSPAERDLLERSIALHIDNAQIGSVD